jgi:hypothetical protein
MLAVETKQAIDAPSAEIAVGIVEHDPFHISRLAAERRYQMTTIRGIAVVRLSRRKRFRLALGPRSSVDRAAVS